MNYHRKSLVLFAASATLLTSGILCWAAPTENTTQAGRAATSPLVTQQLIPLSQDQVKAVKAAKVVYDKEGIQVRFDDPAWYAGVQIVPPAGQQYFDFSTWKVLAVDVENLSPDSQLRLLLEMSAPLDEKKTREINAGIGLNPGEKRTLRIPLPHIWKYASPDGLPGVRPLDTTKITRLSFFMQWPYESNKKDLSHYRLSNLRVEEALTPTAPRTSEGYLPFIDQYGQYVHGEWLEKIHSAADLQRNFKKEQAELLASTRPTEWDEYGGWKNGPQLKATGNFRTEKYQGKWYLVDPDGRLFISQGINVVNHGTDALKVLAGKENWFQSLPEGAKSYLATDVSLKQKYGKDDYQADYFNNVHQRLQAWGINTIGDWSSSAIMSLGKTPYTLQLTDYDRNMPRLEGSKLKFYDVFDAAYINKMKNLISIQAAKDPLVTKSLTDPMCIGYFIDNELDFGNRGRMTLVDDVLKSPAKQASKQEFVNDLKLKYGGVEALNTSWETKYADWNALLASVEVPTSAGYKADAQVFFLKAVDQYFRLAKDAIKSVAPNRLYLGARLIGTDAVRRSLYEACQKYSDVLTVNIYGHSIANFPVENFPDMPVMVTEFHFGVLQRGMFNASLAQAGVTPEERGLAYTRFLQGALAHPNIVGAHWFQFRDQPLTGRGDGEAYQIGFVDVADTPYSEITQAARYIGENMYQYRANGKLVNTMR